MAKKNGNKRKTKKVKTKAKVDETPELKLSELEQQIISANAELAKVWSEAVKICDEKAAADKEFEEYQQNVKDIKEYLKYEIKSEEDWVQDLEERIQVMEEKNNKQTKYYQEIINKREAAANALLEDQETQKSNLKTTLIILKHFEGQRLDYLEKLSDLVKQENDQEARHKDELYEEEKKLRLEKVPLKREMLQQLHKLLFPLKTLMQAPSKEREQKKETENAEILQKIAGLSEHYNKLLKDHKNVKEAADEAKMNVVLMKERIAMVENVNKVRKTTLQPISVVVKESEELNFLPQSESVDKNSRTEKSSRSLAFASQDDIFESKKSDQDGIRGFLNEIETLIVDAIDIQETQVTDEDGDKLSLTASMAEEEKDRMFEKRQQLIDEIINRIDSFLAPIPEPIPDISLLDITPRRKSKSVKQTKVGNSLKRCELYKNLHVSKKIAVAKLRNRVPWHLKDCSLCSPSKTKDFLL